jgi:hypothetical protein
MKTEEADRLLAMHDQLWEHLRRAGGVESYEEVIARVCEEVREKETSLAPWLHKMARAMYRGNELDSIQPEDFYAILGLIDNREKARAVLLSLPDEMASEIEQGVTFVLKEVLPTLRTHAQSSIKHLPYRRSGGPKPTMPSDEECLEIYDEILAEYRETGLMGEAERNVALKRKLNVRMVQRIKKECQDRLAAENKKPDGRKS